MISAPPPHPCHCLLLTVCHDFGHLRPVVDAFVICYTTLYGYVHFVPFFGTSNICTVFPIGLLPRHAHTMGGRRVPRSFRALPALYCPATLTPVRARYAAPPRPRPHHTISPHTTVAPPRAFIAPLWLFCPACHYFANWTVDLRLVVTSGLVVLLPTTDIPALGRWCPRPTPTTPPPVLRFVLGVNCWVVQLGV